MLEDLESGVDYQICGERFLQELQNAYTMLPNVHSFLDNLWIKRIVVSNEIILENPLILYTS